MTHSSPVSQQGLALLELSWWFTIHLLYHFQSVKTGSVISEYFELYIRVPQGSVLSHLLFSLYTSPISHVPANYMDVKHHFYADNSQLFIYLSPQNCANSCHQLNSCLNDIHIWMFENKLKLNPEFIVFGSMDKYK